MASCFTQRSLPIGNQAPSRTFRPGGARPDRNRDRFGRSDRYNQSDSARVNGEIRAREVRVIDAEGQQVGILPTRDALALAAEKELDLVEVAPNADPPVCRLMNYGKYLYEKQKRERESRKAHKQIEVKEVQMGPKTDEHDIQVILNRIRKFAKEGAKIRVRVKFKGREIYHPEVAQELLQRVATDAADATTVESMPAFDGKSLIMVLTPATSH